MTSRKCDTGRGAESRAMQFVRAATWSFILVAALGFWGAVGLGLLAYLRP